LFFCEGSAALRAGLRRKEGDFSLLTRHLFLSAQARLGNVPGYYRSSLSGLGYCERELVVFLDKVRNGEPTPGGNARVSPFFCCAGAARYGSPQGFRAAGLPKNTATTNEFFAGEGSLRSTGEEALPAQHWVILKRLS
jgi:hypothetical protein